MRERLRCSKCGHLGASLRTPELDRPASFGQQPYRRPPAAVFDHRPPATPLGIRLYTAVLSAGDRQSSGGWKSRREATSLAPGRSLTVHAPATPFWSPVAAADGDDQAAGEADLAGELIQGLDQRHGVAGRQHG